MSSSKDLKSIFLAPSDSIIKALQVLSAHNSAETGLPPGIGLVVEQKKLVGIVTDGDLRRALAKEVPMHKPLSEVMNKDPFVILGPKSDLEILKIVTAILKERGWHRDRLEKIIVLNQKREVINLLNLYDLLPTSDVRFKSFGMIGLGYVGLTLGLTLADLGFTVKGLDINPAVRDAIQAGKPHFYEEGLHKLLADHLGKNFQVVPDFNTVNNCDVYFISVGTPLGRNNEPDLTYLIKTAENLGKVLKRGDLVVLRSTVPIGTTRNVVVPILEKTSDLIAGEDFLVSFAPERTIEGKAIEELRHLPQVVGGINHVSAELSSNIFSFMTKSIVMVDSLEEAEMVKLINNTYRDVTFAFANELSFVARAWGIDTKNVIEAANFGYARSNVPLPSPGVGGYCLEKDPFIFLSSAKAKGCAPKLASHARTVSGTMLDSIVNDVLKFLKKHKKSPSKAKVFIVGFAFKGKPVTSDVRGSTTYGLIERLQSKKIKHISGYDPYVRKQDIEKAKVAHVIKPTKDIKQADVIIVMNNNPNFQEIDMRSHLEKIKRPIMLFDTWGIYPREEIGKLGHVAHHRL